MSIKVNKYITPLLARDCCRGRDRRRTDGVRSRSSVLQRERLGTVCQSPGNVQITAPPPQVQFHPYGDQALLLFHH